MLDLLGRVADPRARRGQRHPLAGVLAAGMAATLAGVRSFAAMAQWAADTEPDLLARLGLRRCPSEATFRRAVTMVDPDELDRLLGGWFHTSTTLVNGRRVIAIDGKSVRGARTQDAAAPHLVAAFDQGSGTVLGQIAVAAKSNEIPAAQDLLAILEKTQMLAGAVITLDALHTQTETAQAITAAGADYVLTVKANQKSLYLDCKRLPWKHIPAHSGVETGHGRRVHRAIKITTAPAWIQFPAATQIAKVRRTVTRPHPKKPGRTKKTIEIVYVITSADHLAAPAETLAAWVQGHWGIENRLHWVRDVTFDEDRSQIRTGNAPRTMATLRSAALSLHRLTGATNIAAALRHHARHPAKIIHLLTSHVPTRHTLT
ncbi:ISAs1 family transposase [Kineosporia corallincola]